MAKDVRKLELLLFFLSGEEPVQLMLGDPQSVLCYIDNILDKISTLEDRVAALIKGREAFYICELFINVYILLGKGRYLRVLQFPKRSPRFYGVMGSSSSITEHQPEPSSFIVDHHIQSGDLCSNCCSRSICATLSSITQSQHPLNLSTPLTEAVKCLHNFTIGVLPDSPPPPPPPPPRESLARETK